MKNIKNPILFLSVALLLTACGGGANSASSQQQKNSSIKLINPEDTSMLTENCKAYIDAMREIRDANDNPYKYHEIDLNIEDTAKAFLDTGDVNGKNQTVNGQTPDRSDKSLGVELKFEVEDGFEAEEYKVLVSDNENFENAKEYTYTGDAIRAKNLFVNTEYYWKVVADGEESEVGTFVTDDYPRWIDARPMFNVRDNGGYMTESGQRVKQGLVYRGGEITKGNGRDHIVTIADSAKEVFRNEMKIGVELDLRGPSDIIDQGGYSANAFAENGDIEYVQYAIKSYEQTFTQTRSYVAPIFELLKNADKKPVYYHCFGGADRTGTVGFLLNGLLGVSYEDLVIDFELTSYSSINNEHIRNHLNGHQHAYDRWPALISQIQTDTTGGYAWDANALLKDNIENYLVKACNVPQETIDQIRNIMLEPAE